ncbi:MAG TPA: sporulation/spore germination protein [Nostocaceae cyanobacterium]|nr:sporulation/spore germination protein [Nostocaceae cyanobacterium]
MMNNHKRYIFPFLLVAILFTASSCSSELASEQSPESATEAPSSESLSTPNRPVIQSPRSQTLNTDPSTAQPQKAVTNKSLNVTLYTSDVQCQELLPKKAEVSAEQPIANAVGQILEQRDNSDFSLSGYRINVKNGVATVDLRLAPDSKRQLASLSSCEQFALFGSIRKTLISNSQWKIKQVRFTEGGQEIAL